MHYAQFLHNAHPNLVISSAACPIYYAILVLQYEQYILHNSNTTYDIVLLRQPEFSTRSPIPGKPKASGLKYSRVPTS